MKDGGEANTPSMLDDGYGAAAGATLPDEDDDPGGKRLKMTDLQSALGAVEWGTILGPAMKEVGRTLNEQLTAELDRRCHQIDNVLKDQDVKNLNRIEKYQEQTEKRFGQLEEAMKCMSTAPSKWKF